MKLTPEQIQAAREKYDITPVAVDNRIAEFDAAWGDSPEEQETGVIDTFAKNVRDAFTKRTETAAGEQERRDISPIRKALRTVGEAGGFAGDVGLEAVKAVVPKKVEDFASGTLEKIAGTKAAQGLIKDIQKITEKHPEAAKDVEAIFNILGLVPSIKGAEMGARGGKALEEVGELGAKALKESAETAIEDGRRSFIRDLVGPVKTKAVKEAEVGRTTEVGKGPFKRSVVEPTAMEKRAEEAVAAIKGIDPKKTYQHNYNVIKDANVAEAEKLAKELAENDFAYPKKELMSRLNKAKESLANNPAIVGDAEKTAQKLVAEIERRLNAAPSKGSELLKIRKEFDQWVESQKGSNVFSPDKENSFSIANREIRNTINDFLDEKAVNVGVKKSLAKQRSLFEALDNIRPKAATEANTAIQRFAQRAEKALGTKNKAVQFLAATGGLSLAGGAVALAPTAAGLAGAGYLIYKGGKLAVSPQAKKAMSEVLLQLKKLKAGETVGGAVGAGAGLTVTELDETIDQLEQFIEDEVYYKDLEANSAEDDPKI